MEIRFFFFFLKKLATGDYNKLLVYYKIIKYINKMKRNKEYKAGKVYDSIYMKY